MRNPPAFPQTIDDMGTLRSVAEGMTLRDYFAGQALAGNINSITNLHEVAKDAYKVADAMLLEREKSND